VLYFHFVLCLSNNGDRLLEKAVKFVVLFPFVNPARAELSAVKVDNRRYVIQGPEDNDFEGQNAVFLTTGLVTECALKKPAISWAPAGGLVGPPVKRIRIRPFTVEYERTVAFFGNYLDIEETATYGGPIYANGLGFATRKESVQQGQCSVCLVFLC
jgi:hypothetical protein